MFYFSIRSNNLKKIQAYEDEIKALKGAVESFESLSNQKINSSFEVIATLAYL